MTIKVNGLFQIPSGRRFPCGQTVWQKLWWKFMPGTIIRVRWPNQDIVITEDNPLWDWSIGPSKYIVQSSDPNETYRPDLEKHCGRQGWDWDWGMANDDVLENKLTIKIRRKYAGHAIMFGLKWG